MNSHSPSASDSPNDKDKRYLRLYGKLPTRGGLLHHQLEGRKYFDSADFALSQAHRPSNAGAVETGSQRPLRGDIPSLVPRTRFQQC
ncbi:hypothetical protein NKR23_g12458 [Pleurostoma richardsiae]|uniref:mRNA stability protein n=1 Tax=Pleurostoma richardsiae TaxID=41990 RepID=A0AA38R217_9PEZI|nr:hypothetical protein NKR23_g12458 [Pleurostoma richardsiae]